VLRAEPARVIRERARRNYVIAAMVPRISSSIRGESVRALQIMHRELATPGHVSSELSRLAA
jgi:hypothetical protein